MLPVFKIFIVHPCLVPRLIFWIAAKLDLGTVYWITLALYLLKPLELFTRLHLLTLCPDLGLSLDSVTSYCLSSTQPQDYYFCSVLVQLDQGLL